MNRLNVDSNYSCANASTDVPKLKKQIQHLQALQDGTQEVKQQLNNLENQLHFVKSKCELR